MPANAVIDDLRAAEVAEPGPGHNQPPTPFDDAKAEIDSLFVEATHWLDGEKVTSQAHADAIGKLMDKLRKAAKEAEALRVAEKKPLDDQIAEIQGRYNPLIAEKKGKVALAIDACKKALAPYLQALADEQARIAEEARKAAAEAAAAAAEALRKSNASDKANLADRAQAETLVEQAKDMEKAASKAEGAKAHATSGGRAVGLTTVKQVYVNDFNKLAKHIWAFYRPYLEFSLHEIATRQFRADGTVMDGCSIVEKKEVR